jgi:magnesium transporter
VTISARRYSAGHVAEASFDPSKVREALEDPMTGVWLDVDQPTPEDMERLREQFGFHELALEDSLTPHQRPKVEQYEGYFFLVAYAMRLEDGHPVPMELAVFVGERYLVTVRKDEGIDLHEIVAQWEALPSRLAEGSGYPLYVLLDRIVDEYFVAVDALESDVEALEERALSEETLGDARLEIFRLRKELFRVRRAIAPLRDVLDALQRRTMEVVTTDLEPYYRDVYDHVLRITDYVDTLRDLLSTLFDAHLSTVSNRLNEIVKRLTSWAAIVAVPTLIASIYGMNFRHMPELRWRYGYAFVLGVMVAASYGLYRMFKARDWI